MRRCRDEAAEKRERNNKICTGNTEEYDHQSAQRRGRSSGGALSIVEMLAVLYFYEMNVSPDKPEERMRDRFVLSKGHAAPSYYAALAERGYFEKSVLKTLRKMGSILQGHPDMKKVPGLTCPPVLWGRAYQQPVEWPITQKEQGQTTEFTAL